MDKNVKPGISQNQFCLMLCRKATVAGPPTILFLPPRNGFTLEKIGVNAMGSGLVLATARRDSRGSMIFFLFHSIFFLPSSPNIRRVGEMGRKREGPLPPSLDTTAALLTARFIFKSRPIDFEKDFEEYMKKGRGEELV